MFCSCFKWSFFSVRFWTCFSASSSLDANLSMTDMPDVLSASLLGSFMEFDVASFVVVDEVARFSATGVGITGDSLLDDAVVGGCFDPIGAGGTTSDGVLVNSILSKV